MRLCTYIYCVYCIQFSFPLSIAYFYKNISFRPEFSMFLRRIYGGQTGVGMMVLKCRHLSLSEPSCNSGKFRKMKQATSTFLARSAVKKTSKHENAAFDPEYLDRSVEKLLEGRSRFRYRFLIRQCPGSLEPDTSNDRDNLIEDWNHINETVTSLGVPEIADVIGGQMFAGGHLR